MEQLTTSVAAACKAIGVSHPTLYRYMNDGRLESVRIGNRRLVRVDSLRRLVNAA